MQQDIKTQLQVYQYSIHSEYFIYFPFTLKLFLHFLPVAPLLKFLDQEEQL